MLFPRENYRRQLVDGLQNDMVKIVTGIRRCGKSYLLFNIFRQYLLEHETDEKHIIGLSLDNRRNARLTNPDALLAYIDEHTPDDGKTTFVILDEVQLVDDFVSVLLSLMQTPRMQVYVSGSNSKFLSSDIATEFRGRGWEIRVHPLSFAEYYEGVGGTFQEALFAYYRYGGLPQVAMLDSEQQKKQYLQSVYSTAYLKDVIERNRLRNAEGMESLVRVLASSVGTPTNPLRIANTFKTSGKVVMSSATVTDYIHHLQDAFLVNEALRYDVKGRKYIGTETKYYFEDLGIRNMLLNFRQQEDTHIMENVIYNELCLRGYTVDVGQVEIWEDNGKGKSVRKNLEVDFVVNNPPQRFYIQAAFALPDREKTIQEQRPLTHIPDHFRKIIILGNDYQQGWMNEEGIQIISLRDFLLRPDILQ